MGLWSQFLFFLQCHNKVIFKQLLQAKALSYLQIDSCRLGSVNENLAVLLMAKKFQSKVFGNVAVTPKWSSLKPVCHAASSALTLYALSVSLHVSVIYSVFCHALALYQNDSLM